MNVTDDQLFEIPPVPRVIVPARGRVAPSWVWPSAVEEWERIYRQLGTRRVWSGRSLVDAADREFCRRDPSRRGVRHG